MSDEILKQEARKELLSLGLLEEDIADAIECVVFLRDKLESATSDLDAKGLPRSIAIANDQDAIMAVDEITERVVNRQGLLEKAMQGEDIHDSLATIKAKVESLIVGSEVKAFTIDQMKERMRSTDRHKMP